MSVKKIDADGFSLLFVIPAEGLECHVTYIRKELGGTLSVEALRAYLDSVGVHFGMLDESIDAFCAGVATGLPQEKVLLAQGIPPEQGSNGYLEFPAAESSPPPPDENGDDLPTIDLHHVRAFISIEPGETVARIVPPVPGTPGRSVTGDAILPAEVKPAPFSLGNGVHLAPDGTAIIADISGRMVFQDNQVSLSEELTIKGNLDFMVGNIDFAGIVKIEGDVLDDFHIRAGKGLIVTGVIGACTIESGGNMQLCGMSGRGLGKIVCHGTVFARYLNGVSLEVDGAVIVEKEILNSDIRATGVVMCNGHLAGGTCIARGGIEAKVLGSSSGVATDLVAGADYRDLASLATWYHRLDELVARSAGASDLHLLEEFYAEKKAVQKEIVALKTKQYDNANAKVNIQERIEDQVRITLGETTQEVADLKGPISLIENLTEWGFSQLKLTPLDSKASVLRMEK